MEKRVERQREIRNRREGGPLAVTTQMSKRLGGASDAPSKMLGGRIKGYRGAILSKTKSGSAENSSA